MSKKKDYEAEKTKAATVLKPCTCTNEYMDKKYGKTRRVMNLTTKGTHRCTVCEAVK